MAQDDALGLLESYDADASLLELLDAASLDVQDKPSISETVTRNVRRGTKPPRRNPNRARNQRRHDLIYLRRTVAEMEQQLKRLQDERTTLVALRENRETTRSGTSSSNSSSREPTPAIALWEKIAERQLNERRRVEQENERLKKVLQNQVKVAQALERLIHKRSMKEGFAACGLDKLQYMASSNSDAADAEIFAELLRQVELMYADSRNHFDGIVIGGEKQEPVIRSNKGAVIEIFSSDVLPFPLDAAAKAAWQYFSHDKNKLPFRIHYERLPVTGLPKDTIVEKSGMELDVGETKGIFKMKQVIRQFVEPDRVVVAFCAVEQTVEYDNRSVCGYFFRERGCFVVERLSDEDTRVKCCFFLTPEFKDEDDRSGLSTELTEFMLSSTAALVTTWLQRIENNLVVDQLNAK